MLSISGSLQNSSSSSWICGCDGNLGENLPSGVLVEHHGNSPKWHYTRPQLSVAPGRFLGQLHVNVNFLPKQKRTHTFFWSTFLKTEWFSKIVPKMVNICKYIYIYICISKNPKWKFPFFYENSAESLQVCIILGKKSHPPKTKIHLFIPFRLPKKPCHLGDGKTLALHAHLLSKPRLVLVGP